MKAKFDGRDYLLEINETDRSLLFDGRIVTADLTDLFDEDVKLGRQLNLCLDNSDKVSNASDGVVFLYPPEDSLNSAISVKIAPRAYASIVVGGSLITRYGIGDKIEIRMVDAETGLSFLSQFSNP